VSEVAAWKETANSIFAAFGDVVKDALVREYSDTTSYDDVTGRMAKTAADTATKLVWTGGASKFKSIDMIKDGDLIATVRGSDFSAPIKLGVEVQIGAAPWDADRETWTVIQIAEDDAGVGAIYLLHLSTQGQRDAT